MKNIIHVETPEGEVVNADQVGKNSGRPAVTNDANDNAAGPKPNPAPRANGNLEEKDKKEKASGPGTEVTDGEAG